MTKLQAWWAHRQGFDGSLAGRTPAEVLERTGWARSVGGTGPYLGLFARAGLSREAVDAAVAAVDVCELPSARGCTYVLPACDFAVGLKAGQGFDNEMKTAAKLGVTEAEIDKLCAAVLSALKKKPALDPAEIKVEVGDAARGLGPEGVKKGMSNTLPVALGILQGAGEIRRVPTNGRLDQQRYRYTLWSPGPLAKSRLTAEEAYVELARRYFCWIGPAAAAEFQAFSGLGVKAAKAAMDPLGLVAAEGGFMFQRDREEFERFEPPKKPQYVLAGSIDGIVLLRRTSGIADLPSHAILDRGAVVGLWEYDPDSESIVWSSTVKPDKAMKEAVARMEDYVRTQLGDARSFSLDSPKSRAPRIAALREAQHA